MEKIHCIYAVIIILFIFLLHKNITEGFSATRTNIVYSNYESSDISDRFAKINEEILILEQQPAKERVMKFKYLRAPLNSFIAIYVRKEQADGQESGQVTINTVLIKIEMVNTDLIQTLGKNNVFVNDLTTTIRYYIKALDDKTFAYEKKKFDERNALLARYGECVELKKTTKSASLSVAECKKEYKLT